MVPRDLKKSGWYLDRQKGSHRVFKHPKYQVCPLEQATNPPAMIPPPKPAAAVTPKPKAGADIHLAKQRAYDGVRASFGKMRRSAFGLNTFSAGMGLSVWVNMAARRSYKHGRRACLSRSATRRLALEGISGKISFDPGISVYTPIPNSLESHATFSGSCLVAHEPKNIGREICVSLGPST
jgi:HicA toxin of bacterial toxin-antitoxin,